MNREEKIKLIKGFSSHLANKGGLVASNYEQEVELYLDSLEMNKEKAIDIIEELIKGISLYPKQVQALQFAIDYIKDEGEIIGWVNYYPEYQHYTDRVVGLYKTQLDAKSLCLDNFGICIQIPIRKPKS